MADKPKKKPKKRTHAAWIKDYEALPGKIEAMNKKFEAQMEQRNKEFKQFTD